MWRETCSFGSASFLSLHEVSLSQGRSRDELTLQGPFLLERQGLSAGRAAVSSPPPPAPSKVHWHQVISGEIGRRSGNGSLMFWKPCLFPFLRGFPW